MDSDPITRRELDAIRELLESKIQSLEGRLEVAAIAHQRALEIANHELEKHMGQLNDVRLRFVDKTAWEADRAEQEKRRQAEEVAQTTRSRATVVTLCTLGLTVIGLAMAALRNFMAR